MNDALLNALWVATALMLVIEGIMPFLSPQAFRRALLQMANMQDMQLRTIGFICMLSGLALLYWVH